MNNFSDKWLLLVDKLAGGSKTVFAEKLGMTRQTLNTYITRESLNPGGEILARLAGLGVNVNWFLTGEGEMMVKIENPGEEVTRLRAENALLKKAVLSVRLVTEGLVSGEVNGKG